METTYTLNCNDCGAPLPESKKCEYCGAINVVKTTAYTNHPMAYATPMVMRSAEPNRVPIINNNKAWILCILGVLIPGLFIWFYINGQLKSDN